MGLNFGKITLTEIAVALILGIIVNVLVNIGGKKKAAETTTAEEAPASEEAASTEDND